MRFRNTILDTIDDEVQALSAPGPNHAEFEGGLGDDTLNGTGDDDVISGAGGSDTLSGGDGDDVIYGHSDGATGTITSSVFVTGFTNNPVAGAVAPGDPGYLYVLEKDNGIVWRIDIDTGARTAFLDIPQGDFSRDGEGGALGLAFHPDYAENGRFFVFVTNPAGDLQVREFARTPGGGSPPTAGTTSTLVIEVPHPVESNHNAGWIQFSPTDGYLYIATGDGGGGGDPNNNAQNVNSLLGKILRIDVDSGDAFPADPLHNYAIPAGNPFVGIAGADEIWHFGLRNPFRAAFDPRNGDLYIGDVGQSAREEVDYAASGVGGLNFGWRLMEGTQPYPPGSPDPNNPSLIDPIYDYGRTVGTTVTGGEVYVGAVTSFTGTYVFADFGSDRIFTLRVVDGVAQDIRDRTGEISGPMPANVVDFVSDALGNLYAIGIGGTIWKLTPSNGAENDSADVLTGGAGNDYLDGNFGADQMTGGTDNDTYIVDNAGDVVTELSDEGTDTVISSITYTLGANVENLTLVGTAANGNGNDLGNVITGTAAANTLQGLAGNDTLDGNASADTLTGGLGDDTINGGEGNDTINYAPGDGADAIDGGDGVDAVIIFGGAGAQTLDASWGGSALTGLGGGTLINVESVIADLGAGVDVLRYTGSGAGVTVNIATSAASGFTQIVGVDDVVGSSFADLLVGASGNNSLSGGDGDDQLFGFGGNDVLLGGDGGDLIVGEGGDDTIDAGTGNDTVRYTLGHGLDTINGGDDTDTLIIIGRPMDEILGMVWNGSTFTSFKGGSLTGIETVTVDMGNGADTLRFTGSTAGVTVNIANGVATGIASIIGVENVDATNFSDSLTGNSDANTLSGVDGDDTLVGLGGNDTLLGGGGVDSIRGGGGDDTIDAGNGNDTVHYTLGEGLDATDGGAGVDTLAITGTGAGEVLGMIWNGSAFTSFKGGTLANIETATADLGGGVDTLRYAGSSGNINVNLANGTATGFTSIAGVENVIGATVVDNLTGDSNANNLDGQGGNDVLTGGGGDDVLTGSSGNDRFVFATGSGADTVTDFDANAAGGQDLLDLTGYGITSLDFNARVVIADQGSDTLVTIDGGATILLTGVTGDGANVVTLSDFLLV